MVSQSKEVEAHVWGEHPRPLDVGRHSPCVETAHPADLWTKFHQNKMDWPTWSAKGIIWAPNWWSEPRRKNRERLEAGGRGRQRPERRELPRECALESIPPQPLTWPFAGHWRSTATRDCPGPGRSPADVAVHRRPQPLGPKASNLPIPKVQFKLTPPKRIKKSK